VGCKDGTEDGDVEGIGIGTKVGLTEGKGDGILEGIRQAVEKEENYRWLMTAAQARIEVWRTEQYSARMEVKATQ
jgi:hypothetical protein